MENEEKKTEQDMQIADGTDVEISAESNAAATIISTKDPATMSDEERQTEATLLLERLKALRSIPRSDWHRGFEDVLQVKLSSWGVKYRIHHEVTLGEDAPRIDYLVVMLEDMPAIVEKAFKHFRKQDIIEYKRPGDTINRRIIRKVNGYANFHIGIAQHEGDVPDNEVSVTIFTYKRNDKLFAELEAEGILTDKDDEGNTSKGIYYVKKITDLPYAIVVIDELEGDAYAAFRALSDHASEKDIESVMDEGKTGADPEKKDRYARLLNLIGIKNPTGFEEVLRRHSEMEDYLMDLLQPKINERVDNATRTNLFIYVQNGTMTLTNAATNAGLTVDQFQTQMNEYVKSHKATTV